MLLHYTLSGNYAELLLLHINKEGKPRVEHVRLDLQLRWAESFGAAARRDKTSELISPKTAVEDICPR
jgi:hypothetical protein